MLQSNHKKSPYLRRHWLNRVSYEEYKHNEAIRKAQIETLKQKMIKKALTPKPSKVGSFRRLCMLK